MLQLLWLLLLLLLMVWLVTMGAQEALVTRQQGRHQAPRQVAGAVGQLGHGGADIRGAEHGGDLAGYDLLLHLLRQGILQSKVVASVDQQLVLEMLRRMEILAGWFLAVTPTLNTVIAGRHSSVLDLDVGGRMGELAVGVGASALLPLILPAHLELEPAGVLLVQEGRHVEHRHSLGLGVDRVGGVGHGGRF